MIKAEAPLPASYSPTIMPLTFSLFLQLAVIQKLHMATMDIKSAYLNAALPPDADWIVTTLEPHIAEVCGLDPTQEYKITNALYGLPDSGRLFCQHYKAALLAEGYRMSAFDNCLFYRTTATETTYIIVYVDDTFIFSYSAENIDTVIASVGKHYEVTLDREATSFLGLNLTHNSGTVTITQPKPLSFYGTTGTFHNRSVKQTAVATSSTHAEACAIFTLAKELNFLIALCQELQITLELPAIIMEDNSAVVTMANNNSGYIKKCKHFLIVLNYIKEKIASGQIEVRKIYGKLNNADMHTKPL